MPITRYEPGYDLQEERLERLRTLFPEAFADGELDWDALRDLLGAPLEEGDEYNTYGLFWPGKRAARRAAALPPRDALAPAPGEGVDEETTRHVFIEGDNLEVLKLLRKAYAGRVKVIYIDPPYNTGDDLVFLDDYSESLESYLDRTGQMDNLGRRLTTNTAAGGRYHSIWLSMIHPRLVLARELLREDGALIVSIGDEEADSLSSVLAEVFGENNHSATFCIIRSEGGGLAKQVVKGHDYLFVYARDLGLFSPLRRPKEIRGEVVEIGGVTYWIEEDWLRREFGAYGTCEYHEIEEYHGPSKKREIDNGLATGQYRLITKKDGRTIVGRLRRIDEDASKFYSIQKHLNASANEDLAETGMSGVFDFPKPVSLIAELALGASFFSRNDSDVIMDFFAGSGTTGHGVLAQNARDNGNRRWILVQLPEPLDPAKKKQEAAALFCDSIGKPRNIAELAMERIRRVSARMKSEGAAPECDTPEDLGFRVYKQGPSNYRRWRDYEGDSVSDLQSRLAGFTSPLVEGWDPIALRTEVMLAQGFPLDSRIARCDALPHNAVDVISHEWCEHRLWVCLDEYLAPETVHALSTSAGGYKPEDVFVCLDSALSDEARARLDDRCHVVII